MQFSSSDAITRSQVKAFVIYQGCSAVSIGSQPGGHGRSEVSVPISIRSLRSQSRSVSDLENQPCALIDSVSLASESPLTFRIVSDI